jgi:xanthine dehydrogenase accessory factor
MLRRACAASPTFIGTGPLNSVRRAIAGERGLPSAGHVESSLLELCNFFSSRQKRGEALVLATIVRTEGSTYRKAGARILFSESGESSGLLSGGCLEADLRERAVRVSRSRKPARAVFDSRTSDDPIWGIGLGCEGANDIWLQPVTPANDYAPLVYLNACLQDRRPGCVSTVLGGDALADELGCFGYDGVRGENELAARLSACRAAKSEIRRLSYRGRSLEVFVSPAVLPPALLLCGAGADAVPVAQFAILLGWQVTIFDHRPAYISAANFLKDATVLCGRPEQLSQRLTLSQFDAAVIMSHNLNADSMYLRALSMEGPDYIGLLGPASRRARLVKEAGCSPETIAARIRGPVGLDIGAKTPAGIALAIIAQIHAVLGRPKDSSFDVRR